MRALLLAGVMAIGWARSSEASYILTLTEQSGSVIASGSGTINTAGLSAGETGLYGAAIDPYFNIIFVGPTTPTAATLWYGVSGPTSFGPDFGAPAVSGGGDRVGLLFGDTLLLPASYLSGQPLASTTNFGSGTFSSLGVTAGTYVYTWGSGANADSFTLNAVVADATDVPEPASLALLGAGLVGAGIMRRRRAA